MRWLAALCLAGLVWAQEQPPAKQRPKIGLALAGGSALGFAHIGVLDWLEQHRIPVDRIAGTSMGGLVGGMYATGLPASDLHTFLQSVDWDKALLAAAPFRQLHFRRKEDKRDFPTQLEFGLKGGPKLPSALSPGHGVGLVLSRFTANYSDLRSFDDLPIAFRSVATDLNEGTQVIFDRGDLFTALRATMAIPGVFTPVRRGEQVLVDGGVLNNLPVDVVREMGAEIVIAVPLHASLPKKSGDYGLIDAVNRSIDLMILANERRSMRDAQIVIAPDINGVISTQFDRAPDLIKRGYDAAERQAAKLKPLALSEEEYKAWRIERSRKRHPNNVKPEFVAVEGLTQPLAKNLEQRLKGVIDGKLDRGRLDTELTRLTGLGRYQAARYRFIERDNRPGLMVSVQEKQYGPPFLNTVIELDGASSQNIQFGIGGRVTFLDVPTPGSEFRTDFGVGPRDYLTAEYFNRIRSSKLFVAPRAFLTQRSFDLIERGEPFTRATATEAGLGIDGGYAAGRFTEFRLGYQFSQVSNRSTIASADFPRIKGNVSQIRARFIHEGQDSPVLPTQGIRVAAHASWIVSAPGANEQFPIVSLDFRWAHRLRPAWVVQTNIAGGASISGTNYFSPFFLGGAFHLAALARDQMIGGNYYFSEAALLRRVREQPTSFLGRVFIITGFEVGKAFYKGQSAQPFVDGTFGVISETGIGVIYLGGAFGERGERKVFFRLGRYF